MTDMVKWLKSYEQFRTNPYEKNEEWTSSKYDINGMTWTEISDIVLEDLPDQNGEPMNFRQACSALKKSWDRYKILKREDGYTRDIEYRINDIQYAMGITPTVFESEDEDDFGEWEGL